MSVFIDVMLPVFSIFLIGYLIQRYKQLNIKSLSFVAIYIFIPFLVFRSLLETEFESKHIALIIITLLLMVITILLVKIYVFIKKEDEKTESAYVLTTAFMNAGNYGSPIILFVFGEEAFSFAISFYILQIVLFNTIGVYYASKDEGQLRKAFINILKLPAIYAVVLAVFIQFFNISISENIYSTIGILADGAVPTIMLLLGMQIANIKLTSINWGQTVFVTLMRLLIAPLIVAVLSMLFELPPMYRNVLIILAAMPTAVNVTVYSIQFDIKSEFVSSVTLINTVLSMVTISVLITILT